MIIDCHVHAGSKEEVQELLKSMTDNHVDISIILYWPNLPGHSNPPLSVMHSLIAGHRNLLLAGSIKVKNNRNFNQDLDALENAIINKNIVAMKLYPGYEHFYANDAACDPIYQLCQKSHIPVIFHTGDTWWKIRTSIIRYANPLYIDDVAVKYPKLKILIAHLGNPWIRETSEVVYKNRNVFTDMSGILYTDLNPGRFEKRYNDALKGHLFDLVAYCGTTKRLLFGTDFPLYSQEQYLDFIHSFREFTTNDLNNILYKNALDFFNITVQKPA
jgi:predicted TIM-barrel fold metal-dependent hydrolase